MSTTNTARYVRAYLVVSDVFTNIMRSFVSKQVKCPLNFRLMLQNHNFQKQLRKAEKLMIDDVVNTVADNLCNKLDITVSYKIIRHFEFVRAPCRGWGLIPTNEDKTVSDDIERIRISRNALAHRPYPELTESEMEAIFTDYADISKRFDNYFNSSSNNGYYKTVDDYKIKTIDPEMEEKYKKEIHRLEERCSLLNDQQKITIFLDRDINDMFTSQSPTGQEDQRIKIHLPGVIDSDKCCKVLLSIVMEVLHHNFDIILDNVGVGSLVLFATVKKEATTKEQVFLKHVKQLVCYLIDKGKIQFKDPKETDLVVVLSDPFIDYDNHKIFDEFESISDVDSKKYESLNKEEKEEEKSVYKSFEEATLQMPSKSLDKNEVAKIMERALKFNGNNVRTELRLIMIGKTGVGKSALGNLFYGDMYFKVDDGICSCTDTCVGKTFTHERRRVTLIDTPGLFNTERSPEYIEEQIRLCIGMGAPGPHAVLFVMSHDSRFKDEDNDALKRFISFFGEDMLRYVIVVFTHADKLSKSKLNDFTTTAPPTCKELLKICGNRFVHVDNLAKGIERQKYLHELYSTIDDLKLNNFENRNFKRTEELVQVRENEIAMAVERNVTTLYEGKIKSRAKELHDNEIINIQKQVLHRLSVVRDEVRSEIEHNQAKFVTRGSDFEMLSKP